MKSGDVVPDFVKLLESLTKKDNLIWNSCNFGKKEDSDLAYISPWMICLDTEGIKKPVLQVAKSYHSWIELGGSEFYLSSLSVAIALQHLRVERGILVREFIDPKKVKKFRYDKLLREEHKDWQRVKIINDCTRILGVFKNPSAV